MVNHGRSPEPKKKINYGNAMVEAKLLVHQHRWRLAMGLAVMLVGRVLAMVMPASTKYVIDEVLGNGRPDMLGTVALVAAAATFLQALCSFAISQILGVAAQRAITEMRKRVHAHIELLPVKYFDSMKTGQLISRIMRDAEGVRNLVGTGLVQLSSGLMTASMALGVLLWLNWKMTLSTLGHGDGVQEASADFSRTG